MLVLVNNERPLYDYPIPVRSDNSEVEVLDVEEFEEELEID